MASKSNEKALFPRLRGGLATTVAEVDAAGQGGVFSNYAHSDQQNEPAAADGGQKAQTSMAFIPTLNCIQGRAQFQEETGVVAENIFYFATTSAPTVGDMEEIGGLFQDWALEDWAPMASPNWKMIGLAMRAMNEEEGLQMNWTDGFPVIGTDTSGGNPLQVAYTITWSTGLVGRSARGRTYGVGLPLGALATFNRLKDVNRAAYQINWTALLNNMAGAGHALQVVSFQEGGVPREEGRKLPIVGCNVRFPLATQRRRLS